MPENIELFTPAGREWVCSLFPSLKLVPHKDLFLKQVSPPGVLNDQDVAKIFSDRLSEAQPVGLDSAALDILARTVKMLEDKCVYRLHVTPGGVKACIKEAKGILHKHGKVIPEDVEAD